MRISPGAMPGIRRGHGWQYPCRGRLLRTLRGCLLRIHCGHHETLGLGSFSSTQGSAASAGQSESLSCSPGTSAPSSSIQSSESSLGCYQCLEYFFCIRHTSFVESPCCQGYFPVPSAGKGAAARSFPLRIPDCPPQRKRCVDASGLGLIACLQRHGPAEPAHLRFAESVAH